VILDIVKHAAPQPFDSEDARMDVLFTAGAINKRWREIVINNTSLWSHHFVPNLANGFNGLHYESEHFSNNSRICRPKSCVLWHAR
jgi:hypothetical protein